MRANVHVPLFSSAKSAVARCLTPAVRLICRYAPPLRRPLYTYLIRQYFWWRDYKFIVKTAFGALVYGTTSDTIQRAIYFFGVWEPQVEVFLRARLRPGDTFVDVGANIGYFSLLAATLVGSDGHVVAVEASRSTLGQLRANIERNGMGSIIRPVYAAAADIEGVVKLYRGDARNIGTASISRDVGEGYEVVRCAPLHALLTPEEVALARVVKVDVEGAEALVFRGFEPALGSMVSEAEIIMEITHGLSGSSLVVEAFARHRWTAYALEPEDSIDNYLTTRCFHAIRISTPLTKRTDVIFSRIDAACLDLSVFP